ncbi:hypothetical protein WJX77_009562 [Trebouxia sp. C0004]
MHDAAQPRPASNIIQLNQLSDMNEHLASIYAAFTAELVKLQHTQRQQDKDEATRNRAPAWSLGFQHTS